MTTLDDFFGRSDEATKECSFCGGTEGELIASVSDACGPTHWHHASCKEGDDKKGIPLVPTWDEAIDQCKKENK